MGALASNNKGSPGALYLISQSSGGIWNYSSTQLSIYIVFGQLSVIHYCKFGFGQQPVAI
jgi:hypothetical protein